MPGDIESSKQDREFVRSELTWVAEFLHIKRGLPIQKIRELIREMLDVTI